MDLLEETMQECILLQLVREVCSTDSSMSAIVKSKVNKMLAESDLTPYLSLHLFNTVDESASTALVPWDANILKDHNLKVNQYCSLLDRIVKNGFKTELVAVKVGAKRLPGNSLHSLQESSTSPARPYLDCRPPLLPMIPDMFGIVQKFTTELTFHEQSELNQEIIQAIQTKLPHLLNELEAVCGNRLSSSISNGSILEKNMKREENLKELVEGVDNKLNILKEQEGEKVELMMRWLTFKLQDVISYSSNSTELQAAKTKTLDLKSKILHLQILHSMFTETNQSILAYSELQRDIQESIEQVERRLQEYKHIIQND